MVAFKNCRRALSLFFIGSTVVPAHAATTLWWDAAYQQRFNVAVSTGVNLPDKGYIGYTARISPLDTASLIAAGDMQADCSDLRVAFYDGLGWQELPSHIINCDSATTDVRFALVSAIAASSVEDNYYVYFDNASPAASVPLSTTNVYLWYDDASVNRSGSYVRGRVDNWHGVGWDNSLGWNPAGFYTYDNGDNFTSGYRRAIDERDVLAEAEFFHTGCYQLNITTGMLVRGIIQSGSGASESSNHYYASNRGEYPGCTTNGYTHDGDIVSGNRTTTAINGPNPPDIASNTWRRQGLAANGINPTSATFWDEDITAAWSALGFPAPANVQVAGTHANDNEGRGFAAIMTAQDRGRFRNVVFRRYVQPEPALALTAETQPPDILLQKNVATVFDPVNATVNPKAIPGSWVDYTITTSNRGIGSVDSDSIVITDPLPASAAMFVGDLAVPGSGPVEFTDGAGAMTSGLGFNYGGLSDLTDDVEFSTDGVNFNYIPIPDADGFDAAVRFVRITPSGAFNGASVATPALFDLRIRVRVQ